MFFVACDFDDTLCFSPNTLVRVRDRAVGTEFTLTNAEFKLHTYNTSKFEYDFSNFNDLDEQHVSNLELVIYIRNVCDYFTASAVTVLTSRISSTGPKKFLEKYGLHNINVVTTGLCQRYDAKAFWLKNKIERDKLTFVEFYDDNINFIKEVDKLQTELQNVTVNTFLVSWISSLGNLKV